MIQSLRDRLNALSIQQKQKAIKCYICLIVVIILMIVTILNCILSVQSGLSQGKSYSEYIRQYSKNYSPVQQAYRQFVFYQTYNQIIFHNKNQLDQSYKKGLNQFSDLAKEEFQELYHIVVTVAKENDFLQIADFQIDSYDWSQSKMPAIVKDDRGYDVGHVFATVGVLEFWVNKNKKADQAWITLSEQQIIDCCSDCGVGEQPHKVMKYIINNGILSDQMYPYVNAIYNPQKQQCKLPQLALSSPKRYFPISSFSRIKTCKQLSLAIEVSPVIVGIDASKLKQYYTGIVTENQCETKRSHYMMLVGKGIGYWKLKNSWGKRWGEKGYLRIKQGNTCAICMHGYRPVFSSSSD